MHARASTEPLDRRVARLAAAHYGVFSRLQAMHLGATTSAIRTRLVSGRWERVHAGVYRIAGAPSTWRQLLLAGCLACGEATLVSHLAAAALWLLPGCEEGVVKVSVPADRRCRSLPAHRVTLSRADRALVQGIPVTSVPRTLIDIAPVVPTAVLEDALDDVLRRRITTLSRVRQRVAELTGPGRTGPALVRSLLETRGIAVPVPESVLETRVLRVMQTAGMRPMIQHPIRFDGHEVARVDFAFPGARLAIEADGHRWHSTRVQWQRDRERLSALAALGWRVVHVTWQDIATTPESVVRRIRQALEQTAPPH